MVEKKSYVLLAILVFIVASSYVVWLQREPWFDVSFSLETAHKINVGEEINFKEYDVHPPAYYYILAWWQTGRPDFIFSEYVWGQLLSVVFGIIFIGVITVSLQKLFGDAGGWAGVLMAVTTTYLHIFTEVRMYALVLMLSAILFYWIFAERSKLDGSKLGMAMVVLCLFALPTIHYLAAVGSVFFIISYIVLSIHDHVKNKSVSAKWRQLNSAMFIISALAGVAVATTYALAQKSRLESMWFAGNTLADWPGSLTYTMVHVEPGLAGAVKLSFMLAFASVLAVSIFWLMVVSAAYIGSKRKVKMELLLMASTGLVTFAALFFVQFIYDINLYHNRFFLVVTWMFGAAVFVLISRVEKVRRPAAAFLVFVLIVIYSQSVNRDVSMIGDATPCDKITLVHESPWSAMPFQVIARERGCAWRNVVSTELTKRQQASAGFDAIPDDDILEGRGAPAGGDYYVLDSTEVIPLDGEATVMYQGEGIRLLKVTRS